MKRIRRDQDSAEPLIEQPGSPHPTRSDARSRKIFAPDGEFQWRHGTWNAEAWAEWFEAAPHPAEGAFETLIEAGCRRSELAELLLALYVLPIGRRLTAKMLQNARRSVGQAHRTLTVLESTSLPWISGVYSPRLTFELSGARAELSQFLEDARRHKIHSLVETDLLARLTAFVRFSTHAWHDRDLGDLTVTCLGGSLAGASKARAEWRSPNRNRPRVRYFLWRYRTGTLPERPHDPDEPSYLEDPEG